MQISGEYGTELLLRYTEEQLIRDLERRRIVHERLAEIRAEKRSARTERRAWLSALIGAHPERMPAGRRAHNAAVSQVHAAHR